MRQVELETHSSGNWELLHSSQECGCYYCAQVMPSSIVRDFEENENGEKGAFCPYCGRMTMVTPEMLVPGVPFTAATMRGIRDAICELEVRHTRLSDMFKKDKWAYEHWHDYVIDFWVEAALRPIRHLIDDYVKEEYPSTEVLSEEALKSMACSIAEQYLQRYIAEGTNNSFVPAMKTEIRQTILRQMGY